MVSHLYNPHLYYRIPARVIAAILHLGGIVSFSLSFKYLTDNPSIINETYGWHWKFLTVLSLAISHTTLIFGLLADITLYPTLFYIKNKLALVCTPLEVLISILYWGLCVIDRNLVIFPDLYISPLADIGFHAAPSILLLTDFIFFSPPWETRALHALGISSTIAVAYWAWVEYCYSHNGFYPYPLFKELDTIQRAFVFMGSALLMAGCNLGLQRLYRRINEPSTRKGRKTN